jgi:hypothetical protein
MYSVSFGRMLVAAGLLALTLALGDGQTAPAPSDSKARSTGAADKVKKELDRTINLDCDQQPLALAVAQIHELTKVNFILDRLTLAQNGIDPDQLTVSLKLKEVKARSALRSLLTPYNLNFAILGDTVLISTDEVAMLRQVRQRVSIDLEKVELSRALKQLARETGTNLLLDTRVMKDGQTPVTLQMEDVPLETAVRLMAEMVNLKPVRVGNTLFVTSKANANELRNDPDLQPPPQPNNPNGVIINGGMVMPAPAAIVAPAGGPPAPPPPAAAPPGKPAEEKADKPAEAKPDKPAESKPGKPEKPDKPEKSDK